MSRFIYDMFHLMSMPRSVQDTIKAWGILCTYGLYPWTGLRQRNEVYLQFLLVVPIEALTKAPSAIVRLSFSTSL